MFTDTIRKLKALDNEVKVDVVATSFDETTFISRTSYIHEYVDDSSMVVLH